MYKTSTYLGSYHCSTPQRLLLSLLLLILTLLMPGSSAALVAVGAPAFERVGEIAGNIDAFAISGTIAYIGMGKEFIVVDISNPNLPLEQTRMSLTEPIQDIDVVGSQAYVVAGRGGLQILDVSNPIAPRAVGSYATPQFAYDITVYDNRAYIGQGRDSGFLAILDVSNSVRPVILGSYEPLGHTMNVQVTGNRAYVATEGGGLQILDVSDPTDILLLGTYAHMTHSVAAVGNRVYVTVTDAGAEGVYLLDTLDPANPQLLGKYADIPAGNATSIQVAGQEVYIAARNEGLKLLDMTIPTSPVVLAGYQTPGEARQVQVTDNYVYILDMLEGLTILRTTDVMSNITTVPLASAVPLPTVQSAAARCFPETGYCITGRIREFWEQTGGLPIFGYPITPQREEMIEGQPLQVQWFERNRLELHPENEPPYDVLLGRLGLDALMQRGYNGRTFPPGKAQAGCRFFPETGQNVCDEFLKAWRSKGLELDGQPGLSGTESLALFGLPISSVQTETIRGGTFQVQWFERARLELHPENAPPDNVLLGLLGREMIDIVP